MLTKPYRITAVLPTQLHYGLQSDRRRGAHYISAVSRDPGLDGYHLHSVLRYIGRIL